MPSQSCVSVKLSVCSYNRHQLSNQDKRNVGVCVFISVNLGQAIEVHERGTAESRVCELL